MWSEGHIFHSYIFYSLYIETIHVIGTFFKSSISLSVDEWFPCIVIIIDLGFLTLCVR